MNSNPAQCAAQSVGPANQLFATLIQTLLAVHCSISPPEMWPEDFGESTLENGLGEYSFIVVGSGSSGAVVASRLSEIADWKILLLEAGGTPPIESEIPGLQSGLLRSEFDWQFRAKSDTACLSYPNGCLRPRGKVLGGTSSINSMLYVRGHKHDFDQWSEYGNIGWDYESVLKYFKKSENNQNEAFVQYQNGTYHSDKGPMKIDFFGGEIPYKQIYLDALKEIGIDIIDDVNADKVFGVVASIQGNIWKGRRDSTAKAFLIPAKDRPNLHIIYNAEVQKVVIDENNRATGVEFVYKGKHNMEASVNKEVILSAGSIMSPKILMHSGIGPKEHLQEMQIPVKSDLPVGRNLIEHIFLRIFLSFSPSKDVDQKLRKLDDIYNFAIHNSGPIANGGLEIQMTGFINSQNHTEYPDIQLYFNHHSRNYDFQETGFTLLEPKIKEFLVNQINQTDIGYIDFELVQPKSRGYLKLNSSSAYDKPILTPNYLTDEEDVQAILRSIKRLLPILNTKAFMKSGAQLLRIPLEKCDELGYMSDEYWRCYIHHIAYPPNHTVGTSKMGPISDRESVVDPQLRVRNINGLRQIDGGIMPNVVSGNTNAACIMIAEYSANLIKEYYSQL